MKQRRDETASAPAAAESFFAPVRGSLAVIIALAILGAASSVIPFIAIVELARTLLPTLDGAPVDAGRVWTIVIVAVVALSVSFGAALAAGVAGHFADGELQRSLRRRIVRHLQRLPLGWFDQRSSGAVRKLVENDVVALHQLVAHAIQDVLTAITVPVISLIYLFVVDWRMALAALMPLVLIFLLYPLLMRGAGEAYVQYDRATQTLSGATVEFVQGIAVVKRFGQVGRSHRRYRDATGEYSRFVAEWTRETAVVFTIVELLASPIVVLAWLLTAAVWLVANGGASPVDVLPGLLLGLGLTAPLMKLGASGHSLRNATKARDSLTEFFALPPLAQPDAPQTPNGRDVAFDDVAFSYDGEHHVLHDIAASCAPSTVTALVGASGSGKSTLAKLVPRFYDVDTGSVGIGGADVRQVVSNELYRQVGFVFQDVQLLRASLRDNIRLTRPAGHNRRAQSPRSGASGRKPPAGPVRRAATAARRRRLPGLRSTHRDLRRAQLGRRPPPPAVDLRPDPTGCRRRRRGAADQSRRRPARPRRRPAAHPRPCLIRTRGRGRAHPRRE